MIVLDSTHEMVTCSEEGVMERAFDSKFHCFSFLVLTLGTLLNIFEYLFSHGENGTLNRYHFIDSQSWEDPCKLGEVECT